MHAVWPVTDASDRADVDMDEPADPDGLGGEVTDTVGTRVGGTADSNEN